MTRENKTQSEKLVDGAMANAALEIRRTVLYSTSSLNTAANEVLTKLANDFDTRKPATISLTTAEERLLDRKL
jgi:hypothetical protein